MKDKNITKDKRNTWRRAQVSEKATENFVFLKNNSSQNVLKFPLSYENIITECFLNVWNIHKNKLI